MTYIMTNNYISIKCPHPPICTKEQRRTASYIMDVKDRSQIAPPIFKLFIVKGDSPQTTLTEFLM